MVSIGKRGEMNLFIHGQHRVEDAMYIIAQYPLKVLRMMYVQNTCE